MFDKVARRLPFERKLRRKIRFLIKYHLRTGQYDESWTDSAVRRFAREMDEHLRDLLDLSRADITSKRPGRRRQLLFQISALSQRIDDLRAQDAKQPNLPKGLGTSIMEHFSIPPSKALGQIIKALDARVEAGELAPRQEPEYYLAYLAESDLIPAASESQPG
jgi:poly(A) polymerase